jgi:hypothetical protein
MVRGEAFFRRRFPSLAIEDSGDHFIRIKRRQAAAVSDGRPYRDVTVPIKSPPKTT